MTKAPQIVELPFPTEDLNYISLFPALYSDFESPSISQPENPYCPIFYRVFLFAFVSEFFLTHEKGLLFSLAVDVYITPQEVLQDDRL